MTFSVPFWRRLGIPSILLLILTICLAPGRAIAQSEDPELLGKITDLNRKALEAYDALDFDEARKLLKQALDLCTGPLDKHPIKARTHIHMGVVLINGLKQRELGIRQFRLALRIEPEIKVTKVMANPEIVAAFEEAQKSMNVADSGGGDGDAGGGASSDSGGLSHSPVRRGRKGRPIVITATVSPSLTGYSKIVLCVPRRGSRRLPRA